MQYVIVFFVILFVLLLKNDTLIKFTSKKSITLWSFIIGLPIQFLAFIFFEDIAGILYEHPKIYGTSFEAIISVLFVLSIILFFIASLINIFCIIIAVKQIIIYKKVISVIGVVLNISWFTLFLLIIFDILKIPKII